MLSSMEVLILGLDVRELLSLVKQVPVESPIDLSTFPLFIMRTWS